MAILSDRDLSSRNQPPPLDNLRAFLTADPVQLAAEANARPVDQDWRDSALAGRWISRIFPVTAEDITRCQGIVWEILADVDALTVRASGGALFDGLTPDQVRALAADLGEWACHSRFEQMTVAQVKAERHALRARIAAEMTRRSVS